jgi:opacity protein-like surface antigen
VEALRDLERAMELNDNRAVYRSRLLLDSDLAARSASLARIYADLGFQELALVEGWKSSSADPTSFSAHRFLADSYAALPRHEIARVSELLQSQLLQPLNMTPIQPRLGESTLLLAGSGGPAALSFNEFNPIFNRDRVAAQLSGLGGDRGALVGEGVAAGVYQNASFSAGYSRFQTDGFRRNANQRDGIANAFAQVELTPSTSVQAEYRYRDLTQGDLTQTFDPEAYSRTLRATVETQTFRVGARHELSPGSVLLGSAIHQRRVDHVDVPDEFFGPGSNWGDRTALQATGGEVQHLLRSHYLNLRTGAGYFDVSSKIADTIVIPGLPDDLTTHDTSTKHRNVYAYADVHPLRSVTATAGLAFDSLTGDLKRDQLNPKLGVVWTPLAGTTVRAAAFRTLKRTLITNQTLEPTQVAGFNQFFDDADLTDAWRYGAGVDQRITSTVAAGVEVSRRDLKVSAPEMLIPDPTDPFAPPTILPATRVSWQEDLGRGYVFWTPHRWVALAAEYAIERADRGERFGAGITRLDTQRVPLGVRLFHPVGHGVSLAATYWDQRGTFESLNPKGHDDFWLVDAGLSYRMPGRAGVFAVGVANLLDRKFEFYEIDFNNPRIQPVRRVFAKMTLSLP